MKEKNPPPVGKIVWTDLTVKDAAKIRDFYRRVVGWKMGKVPMGGYDDFVMFPPENKEPAAGICHKRGVNAKLPSCWMIYISVADADKSARECKKRGGKVLVEPKDMGSYGRYCVIKDPSGAVAALIAAPK